MSDVFSERWSLNKYAKHSECKRELQQLGSGETLNEEINFVNIQ